MQNQPAHLSRDRTEEFQTYVQQQLSWQGSDTGISLQQKWNQQRNGNQNHNQMLSVKSEQFWASAQKLQYKITQLERLCLQSNLFDDPSDQIDQLCVIIKNDLSLLSSEASSIKSYYTSRNSTQSSASHFNAIFEQTAKKLQDLTANFKKALEQRKSALQQRQARRQQYSNIEQTSYSTTQSQTLRRRGQPSMTQENSFMDSNGTQQQPILPSFMQQTVQMEIQQQPSLMSQNRDILSKVEATIIELGGMFQQIAGLTQNQAALAERIDHNMEATLVHVEKAQRHLIRYFNLVKRNRGVIIKLFGVLLIVIVVYVKFLS